MNNQFKIGFVRAKNEIKAADKLLKHQAHNNILLIQKDGYYFFVSTTYYAKRWVEEIKKHKDFENNKRSFNNLFSYMESISKLK